MKKKRRELLFLYVAAVAVLIVLIYGLPQVTGALTSTYTVKYGRLRIYDSADGYIVRTEEVYRAGSGGTENRYSRDGKLIRKGTKILEMTGSGSSSEDRDSAYEDLLDRLNGKAKETDSYRTDTEGVVSYTADGYEYVLTPENMTKKSRSFYEGLSNDEVTKLSPKDVKKGDPVFKLCSRGEWYVVCFVPEDHRDRYQTGKAIKLNLDGEDVVRGTVYSIRSSGSYARLIVRTNYYYPDFASKRKVQVNAVTSDSAGLLVENRSIAKKSGHTGVYVKQKTGSFKFVRVNVIATDGTTSVVSNSAFSDEKGNYVPTIGTYDEIRRRA